MTRTFLHSFNPQAASPVVGATVDLNVSDIEDAGVREVLQTPGAIYGAWSVLDSLLTPTGLGTPFVFRSRLDRRAKSRSRFVRTFRRSSVSRAHFNLSIFAHLGNRTIDLDHRNRIKIRRLFRGDLPDWVACASDLSSLTVAEAKGCHEVRTGEV